MVDEWRPQLGFHYPSSRRCVPTKQTWRRDNRRLIASPRQIRRLFSVRPRTSHKKLREMANGFDLFDQFQTAPTIRSRFRLPASHYSVRSSTMMLSTTSSAIQGEQDRDGD